VCFQHSTKQEEEEKLHTSNRKQGRKGKSKIGKLSREITKTTKRENNIRTKEEPPQPKEFTLFQCY